MDILTAYQIGITVLVPVFSAIACGVLVMLSLRDCRTEEELRLKKIMMVYLSLSALGWYMTFCYEFHPVLFTWVNVLCLLSYVLPSMFFYRIVRFLTRLGREERFSRLHYLLPGALAAVLLGWSLFVPMEVQIEIVRGKAMVFPAGYETYARFFTLKPLLRVAFGIAYYVLTIAVLVHYYKKTNAKRTQAGRTAGWIIFLVGISIGSLLSSLLPTFMPRATLLHSLWTMLAAGAMAFQHVLLSYHIIRRKYRLYTLPETAEEETPEMTDIPDFIAEAEFRPRRRHNGMLERNHFETYFREEKPWLNPNCKISDLVEALDVNRSYLSTFINREYGMNFNRYLNQWRLKELEQLRTLPCNHERSIRSLVGKAGFSNYRTYLRAVATEREAATGEKTPDEQEGGTP